MPPGPLRVAWISDFPVEWLPDVPGALRDLPRGHPLTWQRVLLNELRKDPAIQLHIIALRKNLEEDVCFEREGVSFRVLRVPARVRAPSFFWVDTLRIRRALEAIKPEVVHAWGTERGAALIASRLDYPYVVTIQGLMQWYGELIPLAGYDRFIAFLEKISLKSAKAATTESCFSSGYLKQKYPRLSVHRIEHAPDWIFHKVIRQPQISPLRFLTVGTIGHRKGTDLVLQALEQLFSKLDFRLVLVGGKADDPFLLSLRGRLSPKLWARVEFKPELEPAELADELSKATMLLFPTRADTSPNAVKEAVVAGVPVVASRLGGVPDYVFPEENGLLFASADLNQFTQAIVAACQHPLFGQGLVEPQVLAKARDYLSPARMGSGFKKVYESLLNGDHES